MHLKREKKKYREPLMDYQDKYFLCLYPLQIALYIYIGQVHGLMDGNKEWIQIYNCNVMALNFQLIGVVRLLETSSNSNTDH